MAKVTSWERKTITWITWTFYLFIVLVLQKYNLPPKSHLLLYKFHIALADQDVNQPHVIFLPARIKAHERIEMDKITPWNYINLLSVPFVQIAHCSSGPCCQSAHNVLDSSQHTWYLSFFYTTTFWGLQILHSKVRKFATKIASRQNSKITHCVQNYTLCVKWHTMC